MSFARIEPELRVLANGPTQLDSLTFLVVRGEVLFWGGHAQLITNL